MPRKKATTNITQRHQAAFKFIRSAPDHKPTVPNESGVALFSCFVNGTPTTAIVVVTLLPDQSYMIEPQFVAITPDMVLTDHDGVPTKEGAKTA